MKVTVDGEVLSSNVKTLQKLVNSASLSVDVQKGFLRLVGTGNGNTCALTVPCQIKDKGGVSNFSIDLNIFVQALAKRKELTLDLQDSSVLITSKSYNAELLTHAYEAIEVVPDSVKADKGLRMKNKFLDMLRANLPKIELKPLLSTYDYIPIGVKATEEGTFVACFDYYQSAFYFDPEMKGKVEFTLPSNLFSLLAKEIKHQDYTISITDAAMYAYNDMFELAMSMPQIEGDQISLDNMIQLKDEISKTKGAVKIKFKTEGINSLLENAKAVYEKDSTFTVQTKGNKCQLLLKSSFGNVKSMILLEEEPKKDVEFTVDFGFFSTLLGKAPPTLELIVTSNMLVFKNKPVTYILSLV